MLDQRSSSARFAPASTWLAKLVLVLAFMSSSVLAQVQVPAQGSIQQGFTQVNQTPAPSSAFIESVLPGARLAGSGELKFFGFKIYDAHLWVSARQSGVLSRDPTRLLEQAFALDLRYARTLKGDDIAERSLSEMRRLGFGDGVQHERWLAEMKRVFTTVSKGDHITGVHQPGGATRFFLNEKSIGRIDDAEFGTAFFNIWFDPRTRAPALREALTKAPN
jgi:Chalcone isomerase-like